MNEAAKMSLHEGLQAASVAARTGRYEEALTYHIWFHKHALEVDPAFHGVRLSFALSAWFELGMNYPKAIEELRAIRNNSNQLLFDGLEDIDLFQAIVALNHKFGLSTETYILFKHISIVSPEFASRCARLAIPALMEARDFHLARRYIIDPDVMISKLASSFNDDIEYANKIVSAKAKVAMFDAHVHNYCETVSQILATLSETGEQDTAEILRRKAVQLVRNPEAAEAVDAQTMILPVCKGTS
jgi:hypothetical protein